MANCRLPSQAASGVLAVMLGFALACGSKSSSPAVSSTNISIGGTYTIARAWIAHGCDPPTPGATATVTGVITQNGLQFTLVNSDSGRFNGTLSQDASFTNGRITATGTAGERYDLLFEGRFSTTGFTATITLDDFRPAGTCHETIAWTATKQGAPNTIP